MRRSAYSIRTEEDDVGSRKTMRDRTGTTAGMSSSAPFIILTVLMLLLIEFINAVAAEEDGGGGDDSASSSFYSAVGDRLSGMRALLQSRPGMLINMTIRVVIAIAITVNLDIFLKLVVTPVLAASIIGAVAAPLTFFLGQALQPVIHSICFYGFDDSFVMAALEATGGKERLAKLSKTGEWHEMGTFERYFTRWCIKTSAGFVVGFAGLSAAIPIVGPFLTALLAGWAVAWDTVYVPLSGMGKVGFLHQGASVMKHFWSYYWFGFWAVLIEEIPVVGPVCHVYNVYSATFFLERVYLNNSDVPASVVSVLLGGKDKEL